MYRFFLDPKRPLEDFRGLCPSWDNDGRPFLEFTRPDAPGLPPTGLVVSVAFNHTFIDSPLADGWYIQGETTFQVTTVNWVLTRLPGRLNRLPEQRFSIQARTVTQGLADVHAYLQEHLPKTP